MATIRTFHHFSELMDDTPDMYAHYFISAQIYWSTMLSFSPGNENDCIGKRQSAIPTVRRTCTQHSRIRRRAGEKHIETSPTCSPRRLSGKRYAPHASDAPHQEILSAREIEVLVLITKGLINKEIADKLNISLTTVITHRKNITEKLGIKSVSGLTIYAVMNGYIEADRI